MYMFVENAQKMAHIVKTKDIKIQIHAMFIEKKIDLKILKIKK